MTRIVHISLSLITILYLLSCTEDNPATPFPDYQPPTVTWLAPEGGATLADAVELKFSVNEESAVSSIKVYRNGSVPDGWALEAQADTIYTLAWDTRQVADGAYTLEVRATDDNGNLGISPSLLVKVANDSIIEPPPADTQPPDVWWNAPDGGATLQDTATLTFSWFDEESVDSVALYMDGGMRASYAVNSSSGSQTHAWITTETSDGVHIWEARAYDASGNVGRSTSLLLLVQNEEPPVEDRTPPVINWLSPTPGDSLEGDVTLRFEVMDNVGVDSAIVFLNGRGWQNLIMSGSYFSALVTWVTSETNDGNYIIQVKAYDSSQNTGLSEAISFHVNNNRPEVIWVPDDYETIQDAIWASEDGDTIMVRAGTYHEQLQFFDKNVSLVSKDGPEETIIDGTGFYTCAWVTGGQDTTMIIRGFTFRNNSDFTCYGAFFDGGYTPRIVNNIFTSNENGDQRGIWMGQNATVIRNNLFINLENSLEIGHSWGDFSNNMILNVADWAIYNRAINGQLMIPDYNLLWEYGRIWINAGWGNHNIDNREPSFEVGSFRLEEGSPGIDQGRPDIFDIDSTRSDIGVYGGPYAY